MDPDDIEDDMSGWLKVMAAVVGVLLLGVIAIGFMLPEDWDVSRSVVIDAPPEDIHPWVADLTRWEAWAPWSKERDATLTYTFGERTRGEGASFGWSGEQAGQGRLTVLRSDPAEGLWYRLEAGGEGIAAEGSITYAAEEGGTRVTWRDRGALPSFASRYFVPMLERATAEQFGHGLARLKEKAEAGPPGAS